MAANTHIRVFEDDFEISEKTKPLSVDLTTVRIKDKNTPKGILKTSLSVTYFLALVYFLVQLLTS